MKYDRFGMRNVKTFRVRFMGCLPAIALLAVPALLYFVGVPLIWGILIGVVAMVIGAIPEERASALQTVKVDHELDSLGFGEIYRVSKELRDKFESDFGGVFGMHPKIRPRCVVNRGSRDDEFMVHFWNRSAITQDNAIVIVSFHGFTDHGEWMVFDERQYPFVRKVRKKLAIESEWSTIRAEHKVLCVRSDSDGNNWTEPLAEHVFDGPEYEAWYGGDGEAHCLWRGSLADEGIRRVIERGERFRQLLQQAPLEDIPDRE